MRLHVIDTTRTRNKTFTQEYLGEGAMSSSGFCSAMTGDNITEG